MRAYLVDTGWACGVMEVDDWGLIRNCAPIFRRWRGTSFENFRIVHNAKYELLESE